MHFRDILHAGAVTPLAQKPFAEQPRVTENSEGRRQERTLLVLHHLRTLFVMMKRRENEHLRVALELPHLMRDSVRLKVDVVEDSNEQIDEENVGEEEEGSHHCRHYPLPDDAVLS